MNVRGRQFRDFLLKWYSILITVLSINQIESSFLKGSFLYGKNIFLFFVSQFLSCFWWMWCNNNNNNFDARRSNKCVQHQTFFLRYLVQERDYYTLLWSLKACFFIVSFKQTTGRFNKWCFFLFFCSNPVKVNITVIYIHITRKQIKLIWIWRIP